LVAGLLFVLPGSLSILALSILYAGYQDLTIVQGLFYGLKPAVVAVVIEAVVRIGKRSLKNRLMIGIAALAFIGIFFFEMPFPLIILSAVMIGLIGGRVRPDLFVVIKGHAEKPAADEPRYAIRDEDAAAVQPRLGRTIRTASVWLLIWLGPVAALYMAAGRENVYTHEALFFSKAAMVTFGGAYSVLAYVAEECVETYGWLTAGEMLDGLGMAETMPGPLIKVVEFVGFMGAYRNPGRLSPLVAGIAGSIITSWVTYAPCFMWIFSGAPYVEYLRGRQSLNAALSTITAAVVGVILNLSLWFAIHTLFATVGEEHRYGMRLLVPDWSTLDWMALAIALAALIAMLRFKIGMIPTLAVSATIGLLHFLTR
jgi:chromate transporter